MRFFCTRYFLGIHLSAKLLPFQFIFGFDIYYDIFMQGCIRTHLLRLACSLTTNFLLKQIRLQGQESTKGVNYASSTLKSFRSLVFNVLVLIAFSFFK